jgi:hypothetical protein
MSTLREAAQKALEALENAEEDGNCEYGATAALRTALAQQEPRNQCGETCERAKLCAVCARGLEQQEQKPYCYAYEYDCAFGAHIQFHPGPYDGKAGPDRAVPLYTHPPRREAQQEPVAWTDRELQLIDGMIEVQLHHAAQCDGIANRTMAEKQKGWDMERVALLQKIKAHPPRREWQGLTDDELGELMHDSCGYPMCPNGDDLAFARAIEQALKERNT